jgi:NADH dehydrogenase
MVVIVGGGFGGLACARRLDGAPLKALLLDWRVYHLFTPLLYEVASALLNPSDISYPYRACFRRSRNVRYRQAQVTAIDLERKTVSTAAGDAVGYDYLVLAPGSVNNYFGNRNLAAASIGLKTLEEALRLRNHVLSCLERASETNDERERRRCLTFVVAGGGPTGVEYVGALLELLKLVLGRDFPTLSSSESRVVLVEGRDQLLPTFAPSLSRYAERVLKKRGAEVLTGVLVEQASQEQVVLSNGGRIETRTIVWSAGVRANDSIELPAVARGRSQRVEVDDRLRLKGHDDVLVVGDLASVRRRGDELAMLAPVAMQQGRYVARLIRGRVASAESRRLRRWTGRMARLADRGRDLPPPGGLSSGAGHRRANDRGFPDQPPAKPFRYVDKGVMATIGRNAAVAQVGPLRLTGFVGWVTWLAVHIYYLIGFRNRLVVLGSWGWNYVRKDRPIRIVVRAQGDNLGVDADAQ